MMKAIVLAAGYGTRLERDLKNDATDKYKELIGIPKPLLPIGKQPLITYWAKAMNSLSDVTDVYVVTNGANHELFKKWAEDWPKVKLLCEGSTNNESRSGAVACMNITASHFNIHDDVIIIAGDTLFYEDFHLENYITKLKDFKSSSSEANMLLYVTCTDNDVHKYGILETDSTGLVSGFLEKPQPNETDSRKACPCFYFLNQSSLPLLSQFLDERKDAPLKSRDATGNFIAYLYQRKPVYAVEISGRFDVGGLESYLKCHQYFMDNHS